MNFPTYLENSIHLSEKHDRQLEKIVSGNAQHVYIGDKLHIAYQEHERRAALSRNLYSQSLALWMFVPCDAEGKPMLKPFEGSVGFDDSWLKGEDFLTYVNRYEAAEKRVLFAGWEFDGLRWDEKREEGFYLVTRNSLHVRIYVIGKAYAGMAGKTKNPITSIDQFLNHPDALRISPTPSVVYKLKLKETK